MRNTIKIIAALVLLVYSGGLRAQLNANAGGQLDSSGICAGLTITLGGNPTASGGTPPYTYIWSPSAGLSCDTCANPVAAPLGTTDYQLTVTDHVGNSATSGVNITVLPTPALTVTATHDTANYFRTDTLHATVNEGQSVIYAWYHNNQLMNYGGYFIYNYPGIFNCIATNNYGCADTAFTDIRGALSVYISNTDNICSYDSSATINITVSGGAGNYFYNWNNGATSQNLSNLSPGFYEVIVHDSLGNTGSAFAGVDATDPAINAQIYNSLSAGLPDTILAETYGGNGSYLYHWSDNSSNSSDIARSQGTYTLTVTDGAGCSASAQTIVGLILQSDEIFKVPENATSKLPVLQNAEYQQFSNYELLPGVSYASPSAHGSTSVYLNNQILYTPDNNYSGLDSFHYIACLTDTTIYYDSVPVLTTSFCDTATVYVIVADSVDLNLQINNTTCPNICDGGVALQIVGGVAPYKISWSNGDTTQGISNLCTGTNFMVTVTDANQVSATAAGYMMSASPTLNMDGNADTIQAYITGSSLPDSTEWIFTWNTGFVDTEYFSSLVAVTQSGSYCVTASSTTGGGCVLTACDTVGCIGCVWPGDANDDGIVDNNDLLPIGLAYGASGTTRPDASLNWTGQPSPDWTDTLLTGTNYKFVDCNGDGTINADDTLAITLNFGQTHLKSGEIRSWRSNAPALYVNLSPDTLLNGATVTATFTLGSASLPADNVYGLAFTYNYDPKVVDSTKTKIFFDNSWFGNSSTKISLARDFPAEGEMECAITGIDHATRSGSGPIGMATFVITTDNINGLNLSDYNMMTWISDLTVIDNMGNRLQFNEGGDTAVVQFTPSGIEAVNGRADIKLFPNPVRDQLLIQSQNQVAMKQITLIDLLGNTIITQPVTRPYQATVDVSSLSSGAYFVRINTTGGTVMRRLVVER